MDDAMREEVLQQLDTQSNQDQHEQPPPPSEQPTTLDEPQWRPTDAVEDPPYATENPPIPQQAPAAGDTGDMPVEEVDDTQNHTSDGEDEMAHPTDVVLGG